MKRQFQIKFTYFKQSGKLYATGTAYMWCDNVSTEKAEPVCYMDNAVQQLLSMHVYPGLQGRWDGPILVECEQGHQVLIPQSVKSIIQPWVARLGLRHQGVLMTAVRGCDTVQRDDPVKLIARALRGEMLEPHCGAISKSASFMLKYEPEELQKLHTAFAKSFDHYPLHYVMHLVHAAEIVGYYHNPVWKQFYERMCDKLHMTPETKAELDNRLNADEDTFRRQQA